MDNMLKCLRMIHAAYDADGADLSAWAGRAADELERVAALADSEGTRAVEYLRRARKAEAEELRAAQEADELRAKLDAVRKACGEAVAAASEPRTKTVPEARQWDDGYKNGVQACATVAWAALTHRRV